MMRRSIAVLVAVVAVVAFAGGVAAYVALHHTASRLKGGVGLPCIPDGHGNASCPDEALPQPKIHRREAPNTL